MNEKTRVYLINILGGIFIILFAPLFYFAIERRFSWWELELFLVATVPTVLIGLLYSFWYMKKEYGPEWYRAKVGPSPEFIKSIRKKPKVRFFLYTGLLTLLLGIASSIIFQDPMHFLFFASMGYVIAYQGAHEWYKYYPSNIRKFYEIGYKMALFLWLASLLGLIEFILRIIKF
ncbi:MAG: hypothetical protein QW272_09325 [Candidatus Methanomethylicaceae archaeon]